jgi:hypothetical protein
MIRLRTRLLVERIFEGDWWEAVKTVGSYAADGFLSLVPSFESYDAITQVATGRLVPFGEVMSGLLTLGVIYPVLLLMLGWALLERRDLVGGRS